MDPTAPMAAKLRNFPDIMKEFETRFPGEPRGRDEIGSSIRSKTSWKEVLEVLHNAAAAYAAEAGVKGAMKRIKTFIEDRADTLERLSHLVPDIDYAKPIVGTLTFLLQAFKQTSKVREQIGDGIESLKKNFDLVETYIGIYSAKPRVIEAATTLYITILKAIEEVIGYYTKHIVIKGIKAVWNGDKYEASLLSCLENITEVSKELIREADTAHKQVTNKLANDVETGFKQIEGWMNAMFKDHLTEVEAKHEKEKQLLKHEIEKRDAERARFEQLYYRAIALEPPPVAECIVKQEDLLQFLDLAGLETADIDYITHQRELIISRGQDRTQQIMQSRQFREWLVQANSKELLIHGNSEPLPVSPISFFCAMLTQNLRGIEKFKSVAYFCGCHPYDDFGGGRTLIMSLLSQLLQQQSFDLSFIDHEIACRMDSGDTSAFCYIFGRLVEQVRRGETVFCVIDGINFYECNGEEPLQEVADVLRFLLDLAEERGPSYKILVTSPSGTEDVRQDIRDEDYFALSEQAVNTLGFSKERFGRQWQEGFEAGPG
ncbi:hypothetical protein NUW58_g5995 [Xylaria curta]|uniref:Uncharacterized protein n=1 Tax=Xylaria curta TaxID=42375 RepID=A0ACC1NYX3_9PEZI|nr:hypothetical protein NUW58_g5995 [Xylaria curta]